MSRGPTTATPSPSCTNCVEPPTEVNRATRRTPARIIIDVVEAPEPPRRLLLGSDAVKLALASGTERDEEARQWAAVSRSADFPE
jgi:hypothetical protein